MESIKRCGWSRDDKLMIKYHDEEWGVPLHDDYKLFEYFVLDAFQAGLSWKTILYRRQGFRKAFSNFDFSKVADYTDKDFHRLMNDSGIIRNKLKIQATIINAQKFIEIRKEFGSFNNYIWQFTNHKTIHNEHSISKEIPSKTKESDAMSLDLKKKGFKFVGSTICYAFMQASGMVNDHLNSCYRYKELKKL